MKTSNFISN